MKKLILHLCADIGSDSIYYQNDDSFEVIMIGEKIGVENYIPPKGVYGIIANPVCTEFSTASGFHHTGDLNKGMFLVNHCLRIIEQSTPTFYVIENPYNGRLKDIIGKPDYIYQPWEFGSPWTKKTALWGKFNKPQKLYNAWEDCPKNTMIYQRPGRSKPGMYQFHKSAVDLIPEMQWAKEYMKCDADIRSYCSQGFAREFYLNNQ